MSRKILLVEDNLLTAKGLAYSLEREGYVVEVAENATTAAASLAVTSFDLILLDINLPDGNGFNIARDITAKRLAIPIIFLTARDDETDVLYGLELGATDYIVKPFRTQELLLKIRNLLQLGHALATEMTLGDLRVDTKNRRVSYRDHEIILTALEYRLLLCLLENAGNIVTRERLADEIWQASGKVVNDNTISVYIKRLRQKINNAAKIQTIKNVGYILKANDEELAVNHGS